MNNIYMLKRHRLVIDSYINKITNDNYQEILTTIYKYIKSITNDYFTGTYIYDSYFYIIERLIYAENNFSNKKILDIPINFKMPNKCDSYVEFLVNRTRQHLLNMYKSKGHYNDTFDSMDFTDYCYHSAEYIDILCEKDKVECFMLPIYPGYELEASLYNGFGYHFANIVKEKNKYYLIDLTYSQFFFEKYNNLDRIGVINMPGCDVGRFMLMDSKGKTIATTLLKEGVY